MRAETEKALRAFIAKVEEAAAAAHAARAAVLTDADGHAAGDVDPELGALIAGTALETRLLGEISRLFFSRFVVIGGGDQGEPWKRAFLKALDRVLETFRSRCTCVLCRAAAADAQAQAAVEDAR